jgi:hypothetical protein
MRIMFSCFVALCALALGTVGARAQCASGYTQLSNVFACQQNTTGAPVITSPSTASGSVGTGFHYQITATNSPTSFGATNLPSALGVDSSTGVITGMPAAAGTTTVGLSATNSTGTGNQNLALTISASGLRATNLTAGDNSTGGTSATTASISPAANALVIVSVSGGLNAGVIPTVTGAGGTWTLIKYEDDNGGSGGNHAVALFRDLSSSPGSGPLTISFGSTSENHITWSVDQFSGVNTTGTHGSGAIVQSVAGFDGGSTNTGKTVTLATLGSANNAAYGFVRKTGNNVVVAGTGFTELANNHVSGSSETEAEYAVNKTAVPWTWASESTLTAQIAVEVNSQ